MKLIRFHEYGEPDVLKLEEAPMPEPGPGEIRIRVHASGINYADTMRRRNTYVTKTPVPFVLGSEVAGTVDALGEGVTQPPAGTRVLALMGHGGYAEYAVVPAATAIPLGDAIGFDESTALFVQGLTAWYILREHYGKLRPGETVVVQGAAGGVGSLAVQMAKSFGAGRVIALASTDEKRALTRQLGADVALDYTTPDWPKAVIEANGGKGADIVLEIAGGDAIQRDIEAIGMGGRIFVVGNASGVAGKLAPEALLAKNAALLGFWLRPYVDDAALIKRGWSELLTLMGQGTLRVHVGAAFPLADAAEAHRQMEARGTTGKLVLHP